jgi:hypothetical protein
LAPIPSWKLQFSYIVLEYPGNPPFT